MLRHPQSVPISRFRIPELLGLKRYEYGSRASDGLSFCQFFLTAPPFVSSHRSVQPLNGRARRQCWPLKNACASVLQMFILAPRQCGVCLCQEEMVRRQGSRGVRHSVLFCCCPSAWHGEHTTAELGRRRRRCAALTQCNRVLISLWDSLMFGRVLKSTTIF